MKSTILGWVIETVDTFGDKVKNAWKNFYKQSDLDQWGRDN